MKKAIVTFVAVVNVFFAVAQENLLNHQIIISTGLTSTSFKNENIKNDKYKVVDKQNGINLGVGYTKYVKDFVGISFGLNYSTYAQKIYQKGLFEKVDQVDVDNELYDLLLVADITEMYSISFLEFPLMLKIILGKPKKVYGYIEAGAVYGMFLGKSYEKDGSLENKGSYSTGNPYFNIVSHNNNYYGHEKKVFTDELDDIYGTSNLSGRIAIGLSSVVSGNMTINISPVYTFGVRDISSDEIQAEDYENIFNDKSVYTPTKTSSFGINFGIALTL